MTAKSIETIAVELLRCAVTHDPESRLVGNLRARDLVVLAASAIACCPVCGSTAWVNIDCAICRFGAALGSDAVVSNERATEYVAGEWRVPADGPLPDAVVTYTDEPSPETGYVGWVWWADGQMGDAASYSAACAAAVASLRRRATT